MSTLFSDSSQVTQTLPATKIEPLWLGSAPFSQGNTLTDTPYLLAYLASPPSSSYSAVIICPGGGYGMLSMESEGTNVAAWLQARGVSAFVLTYRLPSQGYLHPVPLLDAQRAIRLVRSRAAEWNLNPAMIGIVGFSAGGHLASIAQTYFDAGNPQASDPIERMSSRPDFSVLVYPVITFVGPLAHAASRDNLLGPEANLKLRESVSSELRVTQETPPTYLITAKDDDCVPWENSQLFYAALQKQGVESELKILATGGHGFGYRPNQTGPVAGWLEDVGEWMKRRHLMPMETLNP